MVTTTGRRAPPSRPVADEPQDADGHGRGRRPGAEPVGADCPARRHRLGRTWFGILLVLGYGPGMALTLIAAGLLLVRARSSIDRRFLSHGRTAVLTRALPLVTASFVVIAGAGVAARSVSQL